MRIKFFALLSVLFFMSSCYIYKPFTGEEEDDTTAVAANPKKKMETFKESGSASVRDLKRDKPGVEMIELQKDDEKQKKVEAQNKEDRQREEEKRREEERRRAEMDEDDDDDNQTGRMMSQSEKDRRVEIEAEQKRKQMEMDEQRKREEEKRQNIKSGKTRPGELDDAAKAKKGDSKPEGEELSIQEKIQPNRYYKITAEGKRFKIMADAWEGDTLSAHIIRKPQKVLRFHKDQIDEESLEYRKFSKPYSDLFTVGSYVAAGLVALLIFL